MAATILIVAALGMGGLTSCSGAASTAGHARRRPVYAGTLRVISNAGPGSLDPVPTYNYAGYELERGYARQLVTYPTTSPATAPGAAWARATTLVPDVAAQVPAAANGGITHGGLVYTYHLRQGVDWSTSPPRQVTAADFIREFQAFCNPGQFPVGNSTYFTSANPVIGLVLLAARDRPTSVTELAELMGVTKQAASKLVDAMVGGGYVRRGAGRQDGRQRPVSLTGRGEELLSAVEQAYAELEDGWATVIGSSHVDRIRRDLTRVLAGPGDGQLPPVRPPW